MAELTEFKRPSDGRLEPYSVEVVHGWPISEDDETGKLAVKSDRCPERYDIIAEFGDKFAVVWTKAWPLGGMYIVDYALWPKDWRQYFPAD